MIRFVAGNTWVAGLSLSVFGPTPALDMDARLKDALWAAKGVLVQFDDAQVMDLLKAYNPAVEFSHKSSPPDSGGDQ